MNTSTHSAAAAPWAAAWSGRVAQPAAQADSSSVTADHRSAVCSPWAASTRPSEYATRSVVGLWTTAPPCAPRRTDSSPSASRTRIASRSVGRLTG